MKIADDVLRSWEASKAHALNINSLYRLIEEVQRDAYEGDAMRTGLLPIIISAETATNNLEEWIAKHCDAGYDPVDDETAAIRTTARLIHDQLVIVVSNLRKLRGRVQSHWIKEDV